MHDAVVCGNQFLEDKLCVCSFTVYYYVMLCFSSTLCPGEVVDLSDYDYNAVASLLKLYLRELPEPLIPQRLLTKMEAATQCESITCV